MTTLAPRLAHEPSVGAAEFRLVRAPRDTSAHYAHPIIRKSFDDAVDHVLPRRLKCSHDVERLSKLLKSPAGFRAVAARTDSALGDRLLLESDSNNVFPKTTTLARGAFPQVSLFLDSIAGGMLGTIAELIDLSGIQLRHVSTADVDRIIAHI